MGLKIMVKGEADKIDSQREVHHLSARKELEAEYKEKAFEVGDEVTLS